MSGPELLQLLLLLAAAGLALAVKEEILSDDEDFGPSGSGVGGVDGWHTRTPDDEDKTVTTQAKFIILNVPLTLDLENRDSEQFESLANELRAQVEGLFHGLPGEHFVTVFPFLNVPLGYKGTFATMDISSRASQYGHQAVIARLKDAFNQGRLGRFQIDSFTVRFTPRGVSTSNPKDFRDDQECDPETELTCTSGQCIEGRLRCDGKQDCYDGSDEINCHVCPPTQFRCDGTRCLDESMRCNGQLDCADRTDELNCETRCRPDQFACRTGQCIDASKRCDFRADCPEADDESMCPPQPCAPNEFTCDDRSCVDGKAKCDGHPDCPDRSDEKNCTGLVCKLGQFRCDNGVCIDMQRRCDGRVDCTDTGADERGCPCSPNEWQCDYGTCIDRRLRCNNHVDCPQDSSDERDCPTTFPTTCQANEFRCSSGSCIPKSSQCDGKPDCPDNSDESACPCRSDQFMCDNGFCIDSRRRCDGYNDCQDRSDEKDCPTSCGEGEFQCPDGSCIPESLRCNRKYDCRDGADEVGCRTCVANQFRCHDGSCIDASLQCNGAYDCKDGSDERDCVVKVCKPTDLVCSDGTCVNQTHKCDGRADCPEREDELICSRCQSNEFVCNNGFCIEGVRRCDGRSDCSNGEDEAECQGVCRPGQFRCISPTGGCIDLAQRCDGRYDCPDYSDEQDCPPPRVCKPGDIVCRDGTCIDKDKRCDGIPDCPEGIDELNCVCRPNEFRCQDGTCISLSLQCNRRYDCPDGSDEINCPTPTPPVCDATQFRCASGQCIPGYLRCDLRPDCQDKTDEAGCECTPGQFRCNSGECLNSTLLRCDGRVQCRDGSDEQNCVVPPPRTCAPGQYVCANGQCVNRELRCDGKPDCTDYSDEADCHPHGDIVLKVYPERQTIRQGQEVVIRCRDEGTRRAKAVWSRADGRPFPPNTTDVHGRLTMPNIQPQYGGVYLCTAVVSGGTPASSPKAAFVTVQPYVVPTLPPTRPPGRCSRNEATCQNGECIPREYVCDGDYDCTDRSDELTCITQVRCEPNEFQCDNQKCVLKVWRCDGDNDCGDHSDEKSCTPSPAGSPCRYDEYRCLSGDQCIPKSFHCDGEFDCQDKSDEIGCTGPTISQPPIESITVEEGATVTITCVAVGNPTPLISWRLNWGHIPPPPRVTATSDNGRGVVVIRNAQPSDQGAWSCEAINSKNSVLAVPDCNLVVKPKAGICRPPFFNDKATTSSDCLRCFCMGVSDTCYSSDMLLSSVRLDVDISVASFQPSPAGYLDVTARSPPNLDALHYNPANKEYRLDSQVRLAEPEDIRAEGGPVYYYWSLPAAFLGNKLSSYGGYLHYMFRYNAPLLPKPPRIADVILKGDTITLYHVLKQSYGPGRDNSVKIRFWEGEWHKSEAQARGEATSYQDVATRSDILLVLQNLKGLYIRAVYDEEMIESSILNVQMDIAVSRGGQPGSQAIYVEKCTCPQGYTGSSCEECAAGYSRQPGRGPYLGECVQTLVRCNCHGHSTLCEPTTGDCLNCKHNTEGRQCERCRRGFYGDARKGSPNDCQPCPCPLITPPNRFSPTCLLEADGEVTCDACPLGYEGRHCERCAPGYQGNPTVPGGSCRPEGPQCDPVGSLAPEPSRTTGLCQCKPLVTGARCDQCKPNSFQLHPESPLGCIDCFCMGITKACASSSWFRQQVVLQVPPSGLTLTNLQKSYSIDNVALQQGPTPSRELVFRSFAGHPSQSYYWVMPQDFLGDKITAYGGRLNYTISYLSGPRSEVTDDPDVTISGNEIFLVYRHPEKPKPGVPLTVVIPMYETSWVRTDNQPCTREHFLMVLADLDTLNIRATYTPDTSSASLMSVRMDIAVDHSTGQERAFAVEQCHCPIGYKGLSCEDCDSGYTRSGAGLYLGLCEPCFCNGHSSDCDPETGFCRNCQHYTQGDFCEECLPGYVGDASGGTPNDCQPTGEPTCRCDPRGSLALECDFRSQCPCKTNVQDRNCNRCKEGFFHLESRNPEGCTPCFCFGVTQQCSSSSYYRSQIRLTPADLSALHLTNRYRLQPLTQGIARDPADPTRLTFSSFPQDDEQAETLFWSLPGSFLGNKLASYGGKLRYTQHYTAKEGGSLYADVDVEITGNGKKIFYVNVPTLGPSETRSFEIELREAKWQLVDSRGPTAATREDMMMVLARVEALLIRASFHSRMQETSLWDVVMDTSVPTATSQSLAVEVEQCVCPPGYIGLSCEECAPGYIRDSSGPGLGRCTRCNCNGHSESCHATSGTCIRCRHNTVGDNCERCADGFYGDATHGTPDDCSPCPCPLTLPSNQFSPTCILDTDGQPTCNACPPGYEGRNCERCSANYVGNPLQPGGRCEISSGGGAAMRVRVEEPRNQRVAAGSTVTFRCTGESSQPTYTLVWTKEGGSLPATASEASGLLTLPAVRTEDSGTYVCTGSDTSSVAQDRAYLLVHGGGQPTAPRVHIEPRFQEVKVGDPVEFQCIAEGFPEPTIEWTGGQNRQINPEATFQPPGHFRIPAARKTDEAEYFCTATNSAGSESVRTILFVKGEDRGEEPKATINPPLVEARPGESVRLECQVSGSPRPTIVWSFSPAGTLPLSATPAGASLILTKVAEADQGVYICTASNTHGTAQAQARLIISTRITAPTARVEPERQTVIQGERAEIRCIVTGNPPPTITWRKMGEDNGLSPRHKIVDNLLIIDRVMPEDRGLYVCRADNRDGPAQDSGILEVERREVPSIQLYPNATQVIRRGGSAIFQCRVIGGIPHPVVKWTRADGSPFTRSTEILSNEVLRFNRVTGDEQGTYICTAENLAGRVTAQAVLHIQGAPVIHIDKTSPYMVRPGDRAAMTCRAEGEPAPSVAWRRLHDQTVLRAITPESVGLTSMATLEMERVSPADAGVYICSAQNPAGTSEQQIQLLVEEVTSSIPEVMVEDRVVSVAAGSRALMRCFVRGTDKPITLQWYRMGDRPLPATHTQSNGELLIESVSPEDAGEYVCRGFLDGREIFEARARLSIIAPPRIQLSPLTQSVLEGDVAVVQCLAMGDQPITVDWSRMGGPLPPNARATPEGRLEIRGVGPTEAGRYLCTAVNSAGRSEAVAEIIIKGPPRRPRKEVTTTEGESVLLQCPQLEPGPVDWTKDGSPGLHRRMVPQGNNLRIDRVQKEDAGRYICTNPATRIRDYVILHVKDQCSPQYHFQCHDGTCIEKHRRCDRNYDCPDYSDEAQCAVPTIEVHIQANRDAVHLGDDLELQCQVSAGVPTTSVRWTKLSSDSTAANVRYEGFRAYVTGVQSENGGVYRCTVDTPQGTFSDDYVLAIQVTPTFPPELAETRDAPYGSTVVLHCQTNLDPPLTYSWTKQGGTIPSTADHANGVLTLRDVRAQDSGTYVCTARNPHASIDIPTNVVVTGVIPAYTQSPVSYTKLPTLAEAYISFDLELSIRPSQLDGLILYNGQNPSGTGDYVSLTLRQGIVEFRYELGSGPTIIRSEMPLTQGEWHTIKISRNSKEGELIVDERPPIRGMSQGEFLGLDLLEPLYVGGVPNIEVISRQIEVNQNFHGCISYLKAGVTLFDLLRDGEARGVTYCDTCATNPCLHGGVCQEFRSTTGYKCLCPAGFSGNRCQVIGDSCYPGICGEGRCINLPGGGFHCYCPYGRAGTRCEKEIVIAKPAFTRDAYMALPSPAHALRRLKLEMKVKPRTLNDSLLAYSAQNEDGQGDFAALTIRNQSVEFRFDTGSGPAIITSPTKISPEEWLGIVAERELQNGSLSVNGEVPVVGRSPGFTRGLNLRLPLYIGGVDPEKVTLSPSVGVSHGFDGCVAHVEVNNMDVDLVESIVDAANVEDCGGAHGPCDLSPCQNEGTCISHNGNYSCTCPEGFTGDHCEREVDVCDLLKPCKNGGTCVARDDTYKCLCPLGYTGETCEESSEFAEQVKLDADGYLVLDGNLLPHTNVDVEEVIIINLSTDQQDDAVILFHGQDPETDGTGQDFLALALVDGGFPELSYELGHGPASIKAPVKVNDGSPHSLVIKRTGRNGSLEVDGTHLATGESGGMLQMLNTEGDIYLGGVPNPVLMSGGRFAIGFEGCLWGIEIQDSGVINLYTTAKSGVNASPCEEGEGGVEDKLEMEEENNGLIN